MKIVAAMDSMKGSLTSLEAGEALRSGILQAMPDAEVWVRPLADGGEGTVEALTLGMGGTLEQVEVVGPTGRPVQCAYGILPDGCTAIVEMSAAAGLALVPPEERNPLHTTTWGVGQILRRAMDRGCRRFLVGIGGSATNDGGLGMLQALGFGMLDEHGAPVPPGAAGLARLAQITCRDVVPALAECRFRIACDVTNPLCGPQGCSAVFGPQKGAGPTLVRDMDRWLERYARLAAEQFPQADPNLPGSGAAGGLGFAFRTFAGATLESGIQIVMEETDLASYIKEADLVVTGEGCLDRQTAMGKAPAGVAAVARACGKPVVAFAGSVSPEARVCNAQGIDAYFPILRRVVTLEEAMDPDTARANLSAAAEQVFRLVRLLRR